jgi:hypothetical protein
MMTYGAPAVQSAGFSGWVKKTFKSRRAAAKLKPGLGAQMTKVTNKYHSGQHRTNQYVPERPHTASRDISGGITYGAPQQQGNVHMLISAINYTCCQPPWGPQVPGGPGGLDTKFAFDEIIKLKDVCGVTGACATLFNQQVTKQNLQQTIAQIGAQCRPGDTFIFYYSGHGDHLPDQDGDEQDGDDECLCTLGLDGQAEPREYVWTRDDELAAYFTQGIRRDVKIIGVLDCCHSGSIMDLDKPCWQGFNAVSLSGCTDQQTSAGTGQGGEFTRALLASIENFQQRGEQSPGVDRLYNMTLFQYQGHHTAQHVQDISFHHVGEMFKWPLSPLCAYHSPTGCIPGEPPAVQAQPQVAAQPMYQPQVMMAQPQPMMMAMPQPVVGSYQPQYVSSYPAQPAYQPVGYAQYQPAVAYM